MFKVQSYAEDYIKNYKNRIEEYKSVGEDKLAFKSFGANKGVYQQRNSDNFMVRSRIVGGIITLSQIKKIGEIAYKYSNKSVRLTSRQNIQFQDVKLDDTLHIINEMKSENIYTIGTGGNSVRNVAMSPLSGLDINDAFDVTEYAIAATNYVVKEEVSCNLPRKFKIAFSSTDEDTGNATFADIGFIAKKSGHKKYFEVYGAGGFGGGPRMSLLLEEVIDPKDVIYYVEAMMNLFIKEGDWENKARARVRHLVKKFGAEEFKLKFKKYLHEAKNNKSLDLNIDEEENKDYSYGNLTNTKSNLLYPTKYEGIYSVYVHPIRSKLNVSDLRKITNFIEGLDYEVSIRLSPNQGLFIRELNGSDSEQLIDIIKDFTSNFHVENSVVCVGADVCRTGIPLVLSQELFKDILDKFKNEKTDIRSALPRLYISGCPSCCGQHNKAEIGFSGKLRNVDGKVATFYSLFLGGKTGSKLSKLSERQGDIPAKKIPEFLVDLSLLKIKSGINEFEVFVEKNKQRIYDLVELYQI